MMLRCSLIFLALAPGAVAAERPNVIVVYTDDQGSVDARCYGAEDLETPHIDALAAGGIRFTQMYSAAPVCSPSRAALLTGRYPQRAGLDSNASSGKGGSGMPTEQVTLAEAFREAGYATGHIGKWHLGYTPPEEPLGQGFGSSFGHMGGCIDNYSHFFYWNGPNRHDFWRNGEEVWHDGEFFLDLMTAEADAFLEANRAKPFFLYFALNTPHYPLQETEKWRKRYADLPAPRRQYPAFVSTIDEYLGKLLAKLDALGIRENTIVVFQSDHGHSTEERTFGGGGSAGPYRGAKFSLFEGGIRVPSVVSGVKGMPAGEVREQLVTACDWYPSLLELCGVPLPEHKLDGRSLVPVLRSAETPTAHEVFHWQSGRGRGGPQWAVRAGDWKLIGNPNDTSNKAPLGPGDDLFLVNLADDVSEMKNLAAEHPEELARLKALHEKWIKEVKP